MKYTIILGLMLLAVLTITSTEANILKDIKGFIKDIFSSKDKDDDDKPSKKQHQAWKSCMGHPINSTQLEFATEECEHEYEMSEKWSKRKKTKLRQTTCFRACQLEHLGWLWENGTYTAFNLTMATNSIEAIFPEPAVPGIKTGVSKCFEEANSHGSLSDDDHCHSYRQVLRCIDIALYENCKKGKGGKHHHKPTKTTTTTTTTEESTPMEEITSTESDAAEEVSGETESEEAAATTEAAGSGDDD